MIQGLPSKIYALCYIEPQTGYSLAQKIYDVKKYPPTSKIYGWTKILEEKGFIKKENNVFVSQVKPLVDEIESILKSKQMDFSSIDIELVGELFNSSAFRSYVGVLVTTERIRKNGINFLESVLTYLMTSCIYILDIRKLLNEKDPLEFYKKMNNGKLKTKIKYSKGYYPNMYYPLWINDLKNTDIDFYKKLKFEFKGVDKLWKIIQDRFIEDIEKAVKFGNMDRGEFIHDYTNSSRVSIMLWMLPNKTLNLFSVLYSVGRVFDITHILGGRK